MQNKTLFWLHIRKSAGMTTRALLKPYYREVADRVNKPKTFIQAEPQEYNDILNNYRVVLGEYQFRRCLFAKKFLYREEWKDLYSFAFSREPVDRCISMFFYLFWSNTDRTRMRGKYLSHILRMRFDLSYAFDVFLATVMEAHQSESIFHPMGLHFTTHVASMSTDITDEDGSILLSQVYRLESLVDGINHAFENAGIQDRLDDVDDHLNQTSHRRDYAPSGRQRRIIEQIYAKDFEIYESAWH